MCLIFQLFAMTTRGMGAITRLEPGKKWARDTSGVILTGNAIDDASPGSSLENHRATKLMTNLILIAGSTLIIGLIVGVLIGRSGTNSNLRQRRAEQQIDELRGEYTRYQAQVNEHFMESAHLLRRFNDAYRDVNQHMAQAASRLSNDAEWLEELEQTSANARLQSSGTTGSDVEPPRDYAPKSRPEDKGTLAEDFGLSRKENA